MNSKISYQRSTWSRFYAVNVTEITTCRFFTVGIVAIPTSKIWARRPNSVVVYHIAFTRRRSRVRTPVRTFWFTKPNSGFYRSIYIMGYLIPGAPPWLVSSFPTIRTMPEKRQWKKFSSRRQINVSTENNTSIGLFPSTTIISMAEWIQCSEGFREIL